MTKPTFTIDGTQFKSLAEFARYFSDLVLTDFQTDFEWNGNLDAFNDILRGGFGTPEDGFILRWENSELSRERLGFMGPADARGEAVFDVLVEIIRVHGPGGDEAEDGVELYLA